MWARLRRTLRRWEKHLLRPCNHHWHPIDGIIMWECCHCRRHREGWPQDLTQRCSLPPGTTITTV